MSGCKEKQAGADGDKAVDDQVDVQLSPKALEAAHVTMGAVVRVPMRTRVTAAGTIDFVPSHVARIGPNVTGRVGRVLVVPGQTIEKGAVVAILESVDVGRARTDFLAAQSRLQMANAEVAREEKLLAQGATSERALLRAKTDQSVAQAEVRSAEARLSTLGASGGGTSSSSLVSPLAGRVLEVKARIGQPVGPTDTLVVVGEIDQIWITVDIYERDFSKVHLDDEARVVAVAYPKQMFSAKVDSIDTVVDPERKVAQARIVLANPDGALRPGMTATVRILGVTAKDGGTTLAVPRSAVQAIDGQPFVFVERAEGKYELRAIERGEELEDGVEVVRGLTGTERIAIEGTFVLKSEVLKAQLGTND